LSERASKLQNTIVAVFKGFLAAGKTKKLIQCLLMATHLIKSISCALL